MPERTVLPARAPAQRLHVFWNADPVGQLIWQDGEILFEYSADWLSFKKATPISAQLPLQKELFSDKRPRTFFDNLLPEGNIRTMIARQLGISEGNVFGLLKALGGDCAGALSLWLDPRTHRLPGRYVVLTDDELDAMIEDTKWGALIASGRKLRLTLAGAQQKIPLMLDGGRFFVPLGSMASSHIVKPDIPRYPGSSINEAFCMTLAGKIGLPVPYTQLWRGPRHTAVIVDRYDRIRDASGLWTRLHQEDFTQALGYTEKYEEYGGPGLVMAFRLLETRGTQPAADKEILLRAVVFNAAIGNMDAHAKNFSMMIAARTYRLAPLYDLLSTRVYPELSGNLAMQIGKQYVPEYLQREHWERLAVEARVAPDFVLDIVREITGPLPEICVDLRKRFEPSKEETDLLDRLVRHISATSDILHRRRVLTSGQAGTSQPFDPNSSA